MTKFDPFDQNLAIKELKETDQALKNLFAEMEKVIPEYAMRRKNPLTTVEKFIAVLSAHREERKSKQFTERKSKQFTQAL